MLEIRNLCGGYPGRPILRGVRATVPAGAVTALLGPNGCGKTTLLKTLCGILPASDGEALLDGENLFALPRRLLARKVAYLAQNRPFPEITVERLVLHGRFPYLSYPRRYREEDRAAARQAMESMGLAGLADEAMSRLSGGQQQKAYIAMALAQDTPVILLDEPTAFLDVGHQLQIMRQARALARRGKTVLMILHDLPQALQTADRVIVMDRGAVCMAGTPQEVYAAGALDAVFGVRMLRLQTENGWRYCCEAKETAPAPEAAPG